MADRSDDDGLPPDFGSRVAHEIRSPLNLLAGALAELPEAEGEPRERMMQLAWRGLTKLSRFADRLSLLARIETGTLELHRVPTDLRSLVDSTAQLAQEAIGRRRVEVSVEGDASITVHADEALLGQALQELMSNALRHARSSVGIRVVRGEASARVEVTDDGRGVSPQEAGSVFIRHGAASPRGGLHIGLAMARTIARMHGGDVVLDGSVPGEATTFVLSLPAAGR